MMMQPSAIGEESGALDDMLIDILPTLKDGDSYWVEVQTDLNPFVGFLLRRTCNRSTRLRLSDVSSTGKDAVSPR
jgi:hypothetical protein